MKPVYAKSGAPTTIPCYYLACHRLENSITLTIWIGSAHSGGPGS
jgi:hypothetical protein